MSEKITKRIGCNDYNNFHGVRNHRWFQGFDWTGLFQHKMKAPYTPTSMKQENTSQNKIKGDVSSDPT